MILIDVNVFVYAAREDSEHHARYASRLAEIIDSGNAIGVSETVLCSVLRIVTNPKIFKVPGTIDAAFAFVDLIRSLPQTVVITPGDRHWSIFERLCRESGATGNLIPDAHLAALAIEHDCELITTDRDFKRFAGLRWRHPF